MVILCKVARIYSTTLVCPVSQKADKKKTPPGLPVGVSLHQLMDYGAGAGTTVVPVMVPCDCVWFVPAVVTALFTAVAVDLFEAVPESPNVLLNAVTKPTANAINKAETIIVSIEAAPFFSAWRISSFDCNRCNLFCMLLSPLFSFLGIKSTKAAFAASSESQRSN